VSRQRKPFFLKRRARWLTKQLVTQREHLASIREQTLDIESADLRDDTQVHVSNTLRNLDSLDKTLTVSIDQAEILANSKTPEQAQLNMDALDLTVNETADLLRDLQQNVDQTLLSHVGPEKINHLLGTEGVDRTRAVTRVPHDDLRDLSRMFLSNRIYRECFEPNFEEIREDHLRDKAKFLARPQMSLLADAAFWLKCAVLILQCWKVAGLDRIKYKILAWLSFLWGASRLL
jgi:hypothetical protein